ncbi:ABC transporter ATP-binding protein [Bacillus thuringiensis]|nr:ABC transporter ATP-binding protein [Bacillus thuringiensis]PGY05557.1 ABC transporter ATP-binding protein [Bacillus thuringiensis]
MKDFVLEKENIIRKYGEWTAYDIKLTDTLYTRDIRQPNPALKKNCDNDSRYHTM